MADRSVPPTADTRLTPKRRTGKRRKADRPHADLLPYPDFPLSPHVPTGRWYKKIRGQRVYFGKLAEPQAALEKYELQREDLYAGRTPRSREGLDVRTLCNTFLTAKQRKLDAGELQLRTFSDLHATCAKLVDAFGARRLVDDLAADDFGRLRAGIAKDRSPITLANEIQRVRGVFKFGFDAALIDKPVRLGPEFVKPGRKAIRLARAKKAPKFIEAPELRKLIGKADVHLKAMILLGVNTGLGNTDIGEMPLSALDLDAAMMDYPRGKTGIARRSPLWPETVKAIRASLAKRPTPKDKAAAGLVFVTKYGRAWVRVQAPKNNSARKAIVSDAVGGEFRKLSGRGFYDLRHIFRTVADACGDRPAVDRIMGHENADDMRTAYVEKLDDARLRKITDHIHGWLFKGAKRIK